MNLKSIKGKMKKGISYEKAYEKNNDKTNMDVYRDCF